MEGTYNKIGSGWLDHCRTLRGSWYRGKLRLRYVLYSPENELSLMVYKLKGGLCPSNISEVGVRANIERPEERQL